MFTALKNWWGGKEPKHWLRIPREEESEHIQLLGDSGTGKSQIIHSFLRQIAARRPHEAAVIYDPACEFVKRHFNPLRGDIVLNPLDERCPYWSPASEVNYPTDRQLIAESFFPGRDESRDPTGRFFTKASRAVFARMLEFEPTPQQMISWLQNTEQIDRVVAGTEHAHYVDKDAGNQRGGVLASLAEVGGALKLLPAQEECQKEVVLSEWARKRQGWIFVTSTKDTRDSLRPLQAVFLDLLMKRLMSVEPEWGSRHPCWFMIDEVHSLKRLPTLHDALAEGRKYGVRVVQGTQGRSQYEEYYGRLAKTMLSAPHLKILLRCNEPEGAKWIADMIGEVETEKLKIGTTAAVQDQGRDSINYSTIQERKSVISREEIMALPNLQGYWKYGEKVVGFRLPYQPMPQVTHGFVPRKQQDDAPQLPEETSPSAPVKRERKFKKAEPGISSEEAKELVMRRLQERKKSVPPAQSSDDTQAMEEARAGESPQEPTDTKDIAHAPAAREDARIKPAEPPPIASETLNSARSEPPAERAPQTPRNDLGMSF